MPHLSQLQRDNNDKNVTIIGLTSEDPNNSLAQVQKMVKSKGDVMDYTVAFDSGQETNLAYMKASGQRGIPTSFLVDKSGKIAWIGHPMAADIPLAMVLDDTWDYEQGPALMKKIETEKGAIFKTATTDAAQALKLLISFRADHPAADSGLEGVHFRILAQLPEHAKQAQKLGQQIVDQAIAEESSSALNEFAWRLVDPELKLENRFLDLAQLAADKANEFSGGESAPVLDTVARVFFWRGDFEQALATQKKAVKFADKRMKESLQAALNEYEQALQDQRSS